MPSPVLMMIATVATAVMVIVASVCFVLALACSLADGRAAAARGLKSSPRAYSINTILGRWGLISASALLYAANVSYMTQWLELIGFCLSGVALGILVPIGGYTLGYKRELARK